MIRILGKKFFIVLALLLVAGSALAIGPTWMPGFPMRMGTNIMLMWTPVPGASAYNIYRSNAQGDLGPLLVSIPANNHMDMNVPLDKSVFYTVKALVGGKESPEASAVGSLIAAKPMDPPKWLGHMDADDNVVIRFDGIAGASFYNIYRSDAEAGPYNLLGSFQETKFVDNNVKEGQTYYYQVTAVDKNSLESPRSTNYKYDRPKKVVKAAVASFTLKEQIVGLGDDLWGTEERPLSRPIWMTSDGETLLVNDDRGFVFFDKAGNIVRQIVPPFPGYVQGVAYNQDGNLLVSTREPSLIHIVNPVTGAEISSFKLEAPTYEEYKALNREKDWENDSQLVPQMMPRGLAADPDGNIWVCIPLFCQVHVYSPDGKLLKKIGEPRMRTFEPKAMKLIQWILYHQKTNRMYVIDPNIGTIRAFDVTTRDWIKGKDGEPFYGWERQGGGPGYFQEPRGMDVMEDGNLIFADGIDGRIQLFTPDMDYISTLTDKVGTPKPSSLTTPIGVIVLGDTIYVSEPQVGKVTVLKFK